MRVILWVEMIQKGPVLPCCGCSGLITVPKGRGIFTEECFVLTARHVLDGIANTNGMAVMDWIGSRTDDERNLSLNLHNR